VIGGDADVEKAALYTAALFDLFGDPALHNPHKSNVTAPPAKS
jgi:hypothetical protein